MIIEPLLPNKPQGVPRADDRKVLNGIYWRLRIGSALGRHPGALWPATTCYNRFVRWRKVGLWDRVFEAVSAACDGDLQIVDSSSIRAPACRKRQKGTSRKVPPLGKALTRDHGALAGRTNDEDHALVDANGLPICKVDAGPSP